jgi:hypothetical protein
MTTHIAYPSIGQFRNLISNVKWAAQYTGKNDDAGTPIMHRGAVLPKLTFEATTKLHGTSAAVVYEIATDEIYFESRERIISIFSDNAGFAIFANSKVDYFKQLFARIPRSADTTHIAIFGEWAGKGVQTKVAIAELPKTFYVFDMVLVNSAEQRTYHARDVITLAMEHRTEGVACIYDFKTWQFEIDFENPALSQNEIVDATLAVEAACPVAAAFGITGTGEGIVLKCISPGYSDSSYWAKSKGKEHAASHVKTLAAVDVERVNNINELADNLATDARIEQMCQSVFDTLNGGSIDISRLGDLIKAVNNDIIKEDADTIAANGFTFKDVARNISARVRQYVMTKLDEEAGL